MELLELMLEQSGAPDFGDSPDLTTHKNTIHGSVLVGTLQTHNMYMLQLCIVTRS